MGGLWEASSAGYTRHRRLVTLSAMAMLLGAGYAAYRGGSWAWRTVAGSTASSEAQQRDGE